VSVILSSFGIRILSFLVGRAYSDAFTFKLRSQLAGELRCSGRIAMNANCFAAHIDIATFDGAHFAFAQHAQDALGGLFWIAKQCIPSRPSNKPSVLQP